MNIASVRSAKLNFLLIIVFVQLMVYITVIFDIPIARQVLGFCYFTFLPGFIIIKLLKLNGFDQIETVLFSIGLSIVFLTIVGLLINNFGLLLRISRPLSPLFLVVFLNSSILISGILTCLSSDVELRDINIIRLHPLMLAFTSLPILSIIGVMLVNTFANNVVLLSMLIVIIALFIITVISGKMMPLNLYPFALLMVAISLLYHSSLISNYLVSFGSDVSVEYFAFKTTLNNAYWSSINPGRINSMLSVNILPTIYSNLLNMDPMWVFKIVFPLIFSFVPLGLYQVWKEYVGKKYAFISAFLFMAYNTFYTEMLGLNRQMIAELFFILLLIIILNKKMKPSNEVICFMLLSFGLITSHYGLSEIFLFFIFLTFIFLFVVKQPSTKLTTSRVVFFFILMFIWYIYTSGSAVFNSILEFGNYVYSQLDEFFNPASRGQTVLMGLGLESPPTILNAFSRAFAYATQFFIVVGFVGLITKRVKVRVERIYFTLSLIAMTFLVALILVPGLANTMNMTRFYHVLLFFLAPLCILGAETLIGFISKRERKVGTIILLLTVLTPYFLFQTNFVYEVTGSESWSISLSGYRMVLKLYSQYGFIADQEFFGVQWLSQFNTKVLSLHVDINIRWVIWTYYLKPYNIMWLSNITKVEAGDIVYLWKFNTVYDIVIEQDVWNATRIFDSSLSNISKVYSNGDCEIYKNTAQNN